MSNEKRVYSLLKSKKISVGRGEDGANLCSIPHNENKEVYNINSYSFRIAFKSFWKKEYGELLNDNILIDIGATILVAAGGAVLGEVSHRVKEVKSRKKAKDLAVKRNNEERGDK